MLKYLTSFLLLFFFAVHHGHADVVINEFMASNGNTIADENGDFEDWIELYNTGTETVDLEGWGLSDNDSRPFKWTFPEGIEIAPGEHLLIWASGKDRTPGQEINGILREVYFNIPGSNVSDLENHPSFPDSPSETQIVSDFFDAPRNIADNYGQRMSGILVAPQTGQYTFWLASDDGGELRLSTDENPANVVTIASVPDWTSPEQWDKYASQQSAPVSLVEGERYYLEALMKEAFGGDHLTVRWELPGGIMEEPMSADHFRAPGTTQLHTNFRISSAGEPLSLTRPDGTTADSVPPLFVPRDVSYGRLGDGGPTWHYFADPTPGQPNTSSPSELPPSVTISEPRGFKTEPFTVTLSTDDPSATIRYTLDGSTPGPGSPIYTTPLEITATTTLRASAIEPGMIFLPPATATWLFLDDILTQPSDVPPGWPADREVNNHAMEYGMRQEIVNNDNQRLRDGMLDIPSISLVTDLGHLFNPLAGDPSQAGIYSNSNNTHGQERPVSVELIDPAGDTSREFQIDAGLRLRGGFSRNVNNPKHSFRLLFRSAYGENTLDFPLFDDEGADVFHKVDLRTAQNYSWSSESNNPNKNTFLREVFSRDTQRDMGMPYTRSRYYHLYLNGQYWGLYMTQERGESDWAATYLGGDADDWDTVKTSQPGYVTRPSDGNMNAFHALHDIAVNQGFSGANADNYWRVLGLNPDGTPNPDFPKYVDQDNLINYMLIAHYTGDRDAPVSLFMNPNRANNMYALFNRENPEGFKWLRHDAEHSLGAFPGEGVDWDPTFIGEDITLRDRFNPATLNWRMLDHPEYRMRFADLTHRHLFANGALTPENATARVLERKEQIDLAIIGESARWGRGRTRDATWIPAVDDVLSYISQRREFLIGFYRNRGWFPSIDAPVTRLSGSKVLIASAVPFYYMTDGSDPRLTGGAIHPDAISVTEPATSGGEVEIVPRGATWSYFDLGTEPPAIGGLDWTDPDYPATWPSGPAVVGFAGVAPTNPIGTQTNRWVSGTSGPQVTTTYLRHEFTLENAAAIDNLVMEILRDDGAMLYLNGVEIHRENMPPGTITYDTEAASVTGGPNQTTYFERTLDAAHLLREGVNVLAASVHQRGATSSDKYFDLSLTGGTLPYLAEVPLALAPTLMARGLDAGEWSALTEGETLQDLPDPAVIHQWDFESSTTFLAPSAGVGGSTGIDVQIDPTAEPAPEVLRNTSAQGFGSAHLRVNEPLDVTLTWHVPTTGFEGILIDFLSRRSGQGAGQQIWQYTTDGTTWITKETLVLDNDDPAPYQLDFRDTPAAENNPDFALRVTFAQGDGGTSGNNRFDDFTVTGYLSPNANPPAAITFDLSPTGTASGTTLAPVVIRLLDENGNPATAFDGPVTLTLVGDGTLTGTTTVDAVFGTATFDNLIITGSGAFQLTAEAAGLDPVTSGEFFSASLTELVVPRFIQGDQDADNNNLDRLPYAFRVQLDGLRPNATYRFGNRVALATDAPDNNGAGNAIYITGATTDWVRNTSAPRFREDDLGDRHWTFATDAEGSYTGWFITEPTGNARFTPGNELHMRLLLNDGQGGEETAHILTTTESATVLPFGSGANEGTGIIGETSTAARRLVVLYDETAGTSRPLAATPVEITGSEVDDRYVTFYETVVATNPQHWGTIIPNDLPGGVRRIETRALTGDAILDTRIEPTGIPETINPNTGTTPILLDAATGIPRFLPGSDGSWNDAVNWSSQSVPDGDGQNAILNAPVGGNRAVTLDAPVTIGDLRIEQNASPYRNRIDSDGELESLTFANDGQPARVRVLGNSEGFVEFDLDAPVILQDDLRLIIDHLGNETDDAFGALRLRGEWQGPGGLTKQGIGIASLTGGDKNFTGPILIEQGTLRITEPAVPANTSGVTVLEGGQLRLVSGSSPGEPRIHTFGGGAIHLAGLGRGGDLPPGQELGVLGALRYDPSNNDNHAILTNAITLNGDTDIHTDGTHNLLEIQGAVGGSGKLIKSGGGALRLSADSPGFSGPMEVENGLLEVDGDMGAAAVSLAADGVLGGGGEVGSISGVGSVEPGTSRLTAPQSGAAGYAFVFASAGTMAGNGTLELTSTPALTTNPSQIDIYLNVAELETGDVFHGGLLVDAAYDLEAALSGTTVNLFVAEEEGGVTYRGIEYRVAVETDELSWSVADTAEGRLIEVRVGQEVSGFEAWREDNFTAAELADETVSGPQADPSGMGVPNLMRYALGLGRNELPWSSLPDLIGPPADAFRFRFDPEKTDITYRVLASTDLIDWSEVVFDSSEPHALEPVDGVLEVPVDGEGPRRFFRLEVIGE